MQVSRINTGLTFGRALKNEEIADYTKTLHEGKKAVGQVGNSTFIMPSTGMPQSAAKNTGVSNLVSDESIKYLSDMKTYLGYNVVEDLPNSKFRGNHYNGAALALGDQNINPELLTTEEYGSILKKEEFDEIVKANTRENKEAFANFENVMDNDSAQSKALQKAHERFKALDEKSDLKQKYNKYVTENSERLSIPRESEPDTDFFKFKQFLADDHHAKGLAKLHENGLKYCGDVAFNFDDDEVKAFSKAFKKDTYMGVPSLKIPSLDFDTILDETSDAHKLFKMKIQFAAKNADMLRLDAGWNYVTPIMSPANDPKNITRKALQTNLVEQISKWVKEVKGEDFDVKSNLMYEFEAGVDEFSAFWDGKLIPGVKDRVNIYQTTYMNDGWGSNEAFKAIGWTADELSVGVGNHDTQPLRQIAEGVADSANGNQVHKTNAINPLARILKLDAEALKNPVEFAKAKWAETLTGKNNHFFFMDVFGSSERFNDHTCGTANRSPNVFRNKVPVDYMNAYLNSLKEGFGFNIMDSLEKVFKARGLDTSNSELYQKIVKYRDILADKEVANVAGNAGAAVDTSAKTGAEAVVQTATEGASKPAAEAVKSAKSYKPLWYAAGALAVAGGIYAFVKNRHPKPAQQEEPKKVTT